ncbi:MAG: peptide-methionine (R)-S-oxide reductase MsrB [Deltaproteobacteria bacterium]|nr:peptide-methionine (R)-S-oxide reductase MsrB [Deltaproteobacteria bacterium]MCK5710312.1 peptide-methionine (R)-S-oxide reductase MsrB [Deltaproteobacteria bacterium]
MTKKIKRTDEEWREMLTEEQHYVTRQKGTERPFTGKYHNHKEEGVYKCVGCGKELFRSDTKFDSSTGWPSFSEPANHEHVTTEADKSLGMMRTEVICSSCDAHLGHVFPDGPNPSGLRYCINSCALDFEKEESEE